MNIKIWKNLSLDKDAAAELAQRYDLPLFTAMLMQIRGYTDPAVVHDMLENDGEPEDPFLLKDMDRAVERVRRAVEDFEKIAIYGDYDADGITATSLLYTYLDTCGADVLYYIPERDTEGYGMNPEAVRQLARQGVKLIVTVDNGIASIEEIRLAAELGMDVVVTDHHRPQGALPEAVAVVDPYRADCPSPFKGYSGCGVAFKLVQAMEDGISDAQDLLEQYADLVAVGTIGDVMPVTGENRLFIRHGLAMLENGERCGFSSLLQKSSAVGRRLTATTVAFTLVPRINAAGRMGSAARAVSLLVSEDPDEAESLAEDICFANTERRTTESKIMEQVEAQLAAHPEFLLDRVLVVDGEDWFHGVTGIVASRLVERYGRPCIVISRSGDQAKGSGRSVEGFSLFDAVHSCRDLLQRYGGHPMAAGLSLTSDQIPVFRRQINEFAHKAAPKMPAPVVVTDCKLNPAALRPDIPESIGVLEPFGTGNPEPLFGLFDLELLDIVPVGGGNHLRLVCTRGGTVVHLMKFFTRPEEFPYAPGAHIDFAVTLEAKEFRGEKTLSVLVKEMKPAGFDSEKALHALRIYESYCRGESMKKATASWLIPDRAFFAAVYRLLRQAGGWQKDEWGLISALSLPGEAVGRLLIALDVLEERGLIRRNAASGVLSLCPTAEKQNLEASPVFAQIHKLCVL